MALPPSTIPIWTSPTRSICSSVWSRTPSRTREYEQYAANLEGYELDEGDEDLISGRGFTEGARKAGPKPVGVLAVVGRPNVGKSSWSTVSSAAVPPLWKTRRALRETV